MDVKIFQYKISDNEIISICARSKEFAEKKLKEILKMKDYRNKEILEYLGYMNERKLP